MAETPIRRNSVETIVELFADATTGETYADNRLITIPLENGNVGLVAYGEKLLAEYDESEETVTAYFGHQDGGGKTISNWLNTVANVAGDRRTVVVSDRSPWFDKPNADSAQYIGEYCSLRSNKSPVEEEAEQTVVESLKHLNKFL